MSNQIADAESLARLFHDEYERQAQKFNYETRTETRQFDPASANGRLMIAVCRTVMERMALHDRVTELEDAIRRLADQDATLSVIDGAVHIDMDFTLTDEEREAVEFFARLDIGANCNERHAATLRGLLERMEVKRDYTQTNYWAAQRYAAEQRQQTPRD